MDKETLALVLFNLGAIQFGQFKLKMHEQYPNAPLSPIYINLRIPSNKGNLTDELVEEIGWQFYNIADSENLYYQRIAGLPKAGDPLAEAFILASDGILCSEELLYLEKEETESRRRILSDIRGVSQEGETALVIDDMITRATTKIEGVDALRVNNLLVTDCIVLVDREQGGVQQLAEYGVQLHALFTMTELLNIYVESKYITKETQQKVAGYQKEVEKYLKKHS
ncbi:MAG: hypothetical protein KAQ87_02115 [Candidatus Pacebacteria bacterium]|nr:hypothetical protein [Candidatus Paceibacterota bacterium]